MIGAGDIARHRQGEQGLIRMFPARTWPCATRRIGPARRRARRPGALVTSVTGSFQNFRDRRPAARPKACEARSRQARSAVCCCWS